MPTVELSLSDATYATLRKAAEQRRQPLDEVVEDALDAFFEPAASVETTAGNNSSAQDGDTVLLGRNVVNKLVLLIDGPLQSTDLFTRRPPAF